MPDTSSFPVHSRFTELNFDHIRSTIVKLKRRVEARFPESGLSGVASELVQLADASDHALHQLRRPVWWLRCVTAVALVFVISVALWSMVQVMALTGAGVGDFANAVQGLEAATNEVILLSLILWFFVSLEQRFKRRTALAMLHRLRSMAHVVDMHQLTKDPDSVLRPASSTADSPDRRLSAPQLTRYLDYCSELLSLIGKLAALLAQHQQDDVVLSAVNDIETLTLGLSRKIWQKIAILDLVESLPGGMKLSR